MFNSTQVLAKNVGIYKGSGDNKEDIQEHQSHSLKTRSETDIMQAGSVGFRMKNTSWKCGSMCKQLRAVSQYEECGDLLSSSGGSTAEGKLSRLAD